MSSERQERETVAWFADEMLLKLRANAHKPHWLEQDPDYLWTRLRQESMELMGALAEGDHVSVIRECADVSNFAMMLADIARSKLQVPRG